MKENKLQYIVYCHIFQREDEKDSIINKCRSCHCLKMFFFLSHLILKIIWHDYYDFFFKYKNR